MRAGEGMTLLSARTLRPGLASALLALGACASPPATVAPPQVELTRMPEAAEGGPDRMDSIAGRVKGARAGQQIVLYARAGPWWVQPLADKPFTAIRSDLSFETTTHLGTEYAALLVETGYRPPSRTDELPSVGGGVLAVARAKGVPPAAPRSVQMLRFAGYEWRVRGLSERARRLDEPLRPPERLDATKRAPSTSASPRTNRAGPPPRSSSRAAWATAATVSWCATSRTLRRPS
jgi:hypothetical protein